MHINDVELLVHNGKCGVCPPTPPTLPGAQTSDRVCMQHRRQVEHHLFPQMPRHRLNKIKPAVMALCHKFGLDYQEKTFWDLNMLVWNGLWDVTCSDSAALGLFQMAKMN